MIKILLPKSWLIVLYESVSLVRSKLTAFGDSKCLNETVNENKVNEYINEHIRNDFCVYVKFCDISKVSLLISKNIW